MRGDDVANLRRVNPAQLRAVSSMAAREFGTSGARVRPADAALARRVVNSEPSLTDLPVRGARTADDRASRVVRAGSVLQLDQPVFLQMQTFKDQRAPRHEIQECPWTTNCGARGF